MTDEGRWLMRSDLGQRLAHAWSAFASKPQPDLGYDAYAGQSFGARPDRGRFSITNERSLVASTIMRIGIDAAAVDMMHVRLDSNNRFVEEMDSGLTNCLRVEANIDQAASMFRQDLVMTLCDKGVIAIVPTETSISPMESGGYDILKLRVGEIIAWRPLHVTVRLYNEDTGRREDLTLPKNMVAIVENPLYNVMNEPNSTLQRLMRKLMLLDGIDEQSGSGKLDILIQLPYVVKSETRRQQAEQRRDMIETQLKGSKYGIAYIDGTEKVTQLNRPAENNLMAQIEYLTEMLYGQLGITEEVMKGTADEQTMINYHNRTIEPILRAVAEAMRRTFLTKTARTRRQSIIYIRDPFRLVPVSELANIADKLTRNEIVSGNDMRGIIGLKPSADPKAEELRNKNMPPPELPKGSSPEPVMAPERSTLDENNGSRVKNIMEGQ